MTRAALAYLPLTASQRPPQARPQPRRAYHNPFSRYPSVQPKPRQGVKNLWPQNAPGLCPKTHANPPGITPVTEDAVVGCSVAAESAGGTFDVVGDASRYSLTAPRLAGFEAATGTVNLGRGFNSFTALKRFLGSPGAGNQWHHIVEQTPGNLKLFGADVIQNTNNIVALPSSVHIGRGSISAYYSSAQRFTNGQTVRQWLSTQTLQEQRQFGVQTLKEFGY
jgi:hypothetical protein